LPPFRPRPDHELQKLSDDELIAELRAARGAGDASAARVVLQILVYGFWDLVQYRVSLKVPQHDVEDLAGDVLVRAITSSFAGESVGEFRSWLNTILKRAIADYWRARERTVETQPLERDEVDDRGGPEPWEADGSGYVETQLIIEACLAELSEDHQRVVEIVVFEGRPADDAVTEVAGMTRDNAYQIARRFRVRLREILEQEYP
jgi:RNA polymerase sigma factor (sigma-70 family)